jgi:hypothetical protein
MRAWFGVELRNWRTERRMSSVALGRLVHVSGTTVERIEKNERPCDAALAAAFDAALDAGGALTRLWRRVEDDDRRRSDADTNAARSTDRSRPEPVPGPDESAPPLVRRSFLAATGMAALAPSGFADLAPRSGASSLPAAVRAEDIDQVWAASRVLAGWDNLYGGGGLVREASIGQFNWAKNLLTTRCPDHLSSQLHAAVGRLAVVLGASAFDAYEHQHAAHLLDFAAACAEAADNWHLRAIALNWRARQAIWVGAPDVGLTHAESGLVRADRLTPREQAMLHNARARAWAKMGRRQEVLTAVGHSDEIFSHAKDGEDGPWMAYYDNAQHHGDTGHALFDISLQLGRSPRAASDRLTTAINGHTDAYVRSRALSGTKLATLLFTNGDPHEAAFLARRALDEIGRLRSRRAITDVQALADAAAPHHRIPEVDALRARITAIVHT